VPELPDLDVLADAFHAALAGRPVLSARAVAPLAVRGTPAELAALTGQPLVAVRRLQLDPDRIVVNPMLTGRFQLAGRRIRAPTALAAVLELGPRIGPPADTAPWAARAPWLPPDDAPVELRYRDPSQMGKVYLLPAGLERAVPGYGAGEVGPDALGSELTLEVWRERIRRHPGELKNLLRNQAFIAGIGNAYSDEILHEARLLPFRRRSTLAPDEVDELYRAMRQTLQRSIEYLRERVPPTFERQVRDHLAVHLRGGEPCPRCGTRITQISAGGTPTGYCRGCQH
jgi:formamidopyrimidine-DNA glycosylase